MGQPDGRWEVAAFVNNLFDEEYRVYAFDSSLFAGVVAGVVAGVYAKPRTYGIDGHLPVRRRVRLGQLRYRWDVCQPGAT